MSITPPISNSYQIVPQQNYLQQKNDTNPVNNQLFAFGNNKNIENNAFSDILDAPPDLTSILPNINITKINKSEDLKEVKSAIIEKDKNGKDVMRIITENGSFNIPIDSANVDKANIKLEKNPNGIGYIVKMPTGEKTWEELTLAQTADKSNIVNFKAKSVDENGEEKTTTSSRSMFDDKGKSFSTVNTADADGPKTINYIREDYKKSDSERALQCGTGLLQSVMGLATPITGAFAIKDGIGNISKSFNDVEINHTATVTTANKTEKYSDNNLANIENKINNSDKPNPFLNKAGAIGTGLFEVAIGTTMPGIGLLVGADGLNKVGKALKTN